jgi:erythromycin esterase-like protein
MREYNRHPGNGRKLKFYGFDIQFSAQAAKLVSAYLQKVDPAEATKARPLLLLLSNPLAREDHALRPDERVVTNGEK